MYKAKCRHGDISVKKLIETLRNDLIPYEDDIWITDDKGFPCLGLLIARCDAVLHYFRDENDGGSISLGDSSCYNQTVTFGDIELGRQYVISRETAAECIDLFARGGSRPGNIPWEEL